GHVADPNEELTVEREELAHHLHALSVTSSGHEPLTERHARVGRCIREGDRLLQMRETLLSAMQDGGLDEPERHVPPRIERRPSKRGEVEDLLERLRVTGRAVGLIDTIERREPVPRPEVGGSTYDRVAERSHGPRRIACFAACVCEPEVDLGAANG